MAGRELRGGMDGSEMNGPEREAIERIRAGDIDGLEYLVRQYYESAIKAAFLISRNHVLAEDIAQAAFLRAYERINQYDPARPFRPWFLRSVVNDALMAVTRHQHSPISADTERYLACLAGPEPDPAVLLAQAETKEAIWGALERLAPGQRAVVVSRYFLGLSDMETARQLAVPPGTVRRRLHTARGHLRQLLPAWVR